MSDSNLAPQASNIVKVPINQLRPNLYNPNQQNIDSFDLLIKSIQEDGFTLPVIVNSGIANPHLKDMIIDGEHRWRAALVLAMPEVPVIYKDMDEAMMRASTLRHNKARGHHDALLEAQVIKGLAGEMSLDELSQGLNIDAVELDIMLSKAQDFTSMEDVASLSEEASLEELAGQGLTGDNAQIVAHRHGIISSGDVLNQQNNAQAKHESGQNVRVELIYAGVQAEIMRTIVAKHKTAHEAIQFLVGE